MRPNYRVSLEPREDNKPAVVARIDVSIEILLAPEFRADLEHILRYDSKTLTNPFTKEVSPVRIDEIGRILRGALDLADQNPSLPPDSHLVVHDESAQEDIGLIDLMLLDSGLKDICSVRIEGKTFPCKLVFSSGLTSAAYPIGSIEEGKKLAATLQLAMIEVEDPNSPKFIPMPAERKFYQMQADEGSKKAMDYVNAAETFLKEQQQDAQKAKQNFDEATRGPREPNVSDSDGGGRGYGGPGGSMMEP